MTPKKYHEEFASRFKCKRPKGQACTRRSCESCPFALARPM